MRRKPIMACPYAVSISEEIRDNYVENRPTDEAILNRADRYGSYGGGSIEADSMLLAPSLLAICTTQRSPLACETHAAISRLPASRRRG